MTDEETAIVTLKAEAYDCLVQVEQWQAKLRHVNDKIAALLQKAQPQPAPSNG